MGFLPFVNRNGERSVRWLRLALLVVLLAPAAGAEEEMGIASSIPWSGYWWPLRKSELALDRDGVMSPLRKHDEVTGALATGWELFHEYNPDAPEWFGHCHGWAAAAILEPEPVRPVTHRGVEFSVGDLKGLLAEGHSADTAVVFGQRYRGRRSDPEDLTPEAVWRLCRLFIREAGLPLVMDLSNTPEVWNYPVFAYRVTLEPSVEAEGLCDGVIALSAAVTWPTPDEVGTLAATMRCHFTIEVENGALVPGSSRWVGESRKHHPDFAWFPTGRRSANPHLRYDVIQRLLGEAAAPGEGPRRFEPERPQRLTGEEREPGASAARLGR